MDIIMASPRGFCAGVERAIAIVEQALSKFGAPVYVRHEVVHNRYVVNNLKENGAIFVDELSEVPEDSVVIFSAHGVSQAVRNEAASRRLNIVLDATCPLVNKVHMEVARCSQKGEEVVLIGHSGHAEVEGTLGQYLNAEGAIYLIESKNDVAHLKIKNPKACSYVTQTTLSVDDTQEIIEALLHKYPDIKGPKKKDICYATQNRQDAVRSLSKNSELILVVGSVNSSNSNRLRELATNEGISSYLIDSTDQIDLGWFEGVNTIGITAGASAPEILVQNVIDFIKSNFSIKSVKTLDGIEENISFPLPKELRDAQ